MFDPHQAWVDGSEVLAWVCVCAVFGIIVLAVAAALFWW